MSLSGGFEHADTIGFLVGETNGSSSVSATDIGQTKSQSGQAVTASNFRTDVTANGGSISSSDVGLVKSAAGTVIAPEQTRRILR